MKRLSGLIIFLLVLFQLAPVFLVSAPSRKKQAYLYYRKALSLYKKKQYKPALKSYLQAIRLSPKKWRYLHNTGCLLKRQLKQPGKSLYYLKRAASVEKRSAWSLGEIAGIYYTAKKYKLSLTAFKQVLRKYRKLKKNPPYWTWRSIASIYTYKLKQPAKARPYLKQMLALYKKSSIKASALEWLGRVEYRLLNFKKAFFLYKQGTDLLELYLRKKPKDASLRWNLARSYHWKQKKINKSRYHLRYLIKNFPKDKRNKQWRRWLKSISPRIVEVTFHYESKKGFDQKKFFILPVENSYQKHLRVRFSPKPFKKRFFRRFGNKYVKLYYKNPAIIRKKKLMLLKITLKITPRSIHQGDYFGPKDKDDTPERYMDWDRGYDPEYKLLAKKIVGKEKNLLRKAWLIHEWICRNFTYRIFNCSTGNQHLYMKEGECGTWSATSTALMLAAGIPARRLAMHIAKKNEKILATHIGSEFYHPKYGWVPIDNTGHMFGYMLNRIHPWRGGAYGDHIPRYTPRWSTNYIRWIK